MSDRELLMLIFGALKAMKGVNPELLELVRKHLFPQEKGVSK